MRPTDKIKLFLVDGTYELFRNYYGAPPKQTAEGREVGAVIGLFRNLQSLLSQEGVSHLACAFDHVIPSFRNRLFPGYKTGEGIEAELKSQFSLAEEAARALGLVVWAMVEFEADDAIATAASRWRDSNEIEQLIICSPDKDFAQCVVGRRVVLWDRRRNRILDEEGVRAKFGVAPGSIPDWLALVGDSADGIPGIPRWGAKSAARVLSEYRCLEDIPPDPANWKVSIRGAASLAKNLSSYWQQAGLYRRLATLRVDVPLRERLDELRWRGADKLRIEAFATIVEEDLLSTVSRFL